MSQAVATRPPTLVGRAPPPQTERFVGLAFASADVLFEIDPGGRIGFAMGAVEQASGRRDVAGDAWTNLVCDDDRPLLTALLEGMRPGQRRGPIQVNLAGDPARAALLCLFQMPGRTDSVACALSLSQAGPRAAPAIIDREAISLGVEQMLDHAEAAGIPVRLDLVELEGFGRAAADMAPDRAHSLRTRVAATFRAESAGGRGAAEVAPDRYALIRDRSADTPLAERLQSISDGAFEPKVAALSIQPPGGQALRAMRYALDRFIERGPDDAAATFTAAVEQTVEDATRFRHALATGGFHLAFQPIVDLKTGATHHFEALARFSPEASPAEWIRLAEELGMIGDFDVAVVKLVMKNLAGAGPDISVAANISAASLLMPGFTDDLLAVTAERPDIRQRLLLEITETHSLSDLPGADAAIARLREAGHLVCLDDFGAGAASLDYLRSLSVDYVKIDGRYVQRLEPGQRDALVLKHVVALCRELGVGTIAEMVETKAVAALVRDLDLDLGQGWHFGRPASILSKPEAKIRPAKRRAGASDEWR
ncbi:MAG TPA: EAL domain-containing protein [Caulobacteraceae bacterium]|nr:EAL domain-containing protein [Caulobacteraceae bacterium]